MRAFLYPILFLVLLSSLPLENVQAQDTLRTNENLSISLDEIKLDTLLNKNKYSVKVNVATKTSVDVENTPGTVTVITRDQILATNARTLRHVLNIFVPSLDVLPTGFSHGLPVNEVIYARGNRSDFSQQVLILFNGSVKFNESTLGSYYGASEFTLENVERIEVSTTPTTIYGANAVTVINIVTYEQNLDGAEASVTAGLNVRSSEDVLQSQRYTVTWGNTINKVHIGASLQYSRDFGQAHNIPEYNGGYKYDPKTLRDGVKSSANLTLNIKDISERFEGGLWYKFATKDAFTTGLVPSQANDLYHYDGQQILAYFKYTGKKRFTLNTGLLFTEFSSNFDQYVAQLEKNAPLHTAFRNSSLYVEGTWIRKMEAWGNHEFIIGLRGEREAQINAHQEVWFQDRMQPLDGADLAPNDSRIITSAYVEDNWKVSKQTLILLGLRADYFIGFGENRTFAYNPRVSIVRHIGESFIIKGIVARTFRAPTIYELYGKGITGLYGNKDVEAEKVTSFEFNMLYKGERFYLSLTPFYQVFESSIRYVQLPDKIFLQAMNVEQRAVPGLELNTRLFFNDERTAFVFLTGSYLFPNNSHNFFYVPKLYASTGINLIAGKWNFNFTAYLRGERLIPEQLSFNQKYGEATIFGNLSIGWQAGKAMNVFVMADNLAPKQYAVPLAVDKFVHPFRTPVINIGVRLTPF
jgi:outer membrane receptor for ferrienterochelin and colicin